MERRFAIYYNDKYFFNNSFIMLFHTYTSNPFKERNYPYEPKWDDRLTYQFQENYYKINVKGPFTTYFGYESTRNCTELTAIDLDVCSKMSYLCADEIDSFQAMTLSLVWTT